MNTIKNISVLKEFDNKESSKGRRNVFSIKFSKKNGEIVFLPRAITCGLKANLKRNRLRAVMPVDEKIEKIGHVYPVSIDSIIEFNGMRVIL
jgi:hypothetical protein